METKECCWAARSEVTVAGSIPEPASMGWRNGVGIVDWTMEFPAWLTLPCAVGGYSLPTSAGATIPEPGENKAGARLLRVRLEPCPTEAAVTPCGPDTRRDEAALFSEDKAAKSM